MTITFRYERTTKSYYVYVPQAPFTGSLYVPQTKFMPAAQPQTLTMELPDAGEAVSTTEAKSR